MNQLNLEQAADYLASSTITKSIDTGFSIVHIGKSLTGVSFTLINNALGQTVLSEAI